MTEKSKSNYLSNLEKYLAGQNPALLQASKIFHELDQIEYDLGLIDMDESTASKVSWWPVITLIGAAGSGKPQFINRYLQAEIVQSGLQEKLTVLQHSSNDQAVTLPGTALDGDPRFPFYRISDKIDAISKGEGSRINGYLELKTCINNRLQDKIMINTPDLTELPGQIPLYLTRHVLDIADMVLVFIESDLTKLDRSQAVLKQLFAEGVNRQDTDRIVFVITQENGAADNSLADKTLTLLKDKLNDAGINGGQFFILRDQQATSAPSSSSVLNQIAGREAGVSVSNLGLSAIEKQIANVNVHRSYEILSSLERSIREVEDSIIGEVRSTLEIWKERVHFTIVIILAFFASLLVFAEINTGLVTSMFDPLLFSIGFVAVLLFMLPVHIIASKAHAKLLINKLNDRRKDLNLLENPAGIFEKHLTFWRMVLPVKEPVGWNKKTRAALAGILQKSKDLVQSLNDGFSSGYGG